MECHISATEVHAWRKHEATVLTQKREREMKTRFSGNTAASKSQVTKTRIKIKIRWKREVVRRCQSSVRGRKQESLSHGPIFLPRCVQLCRQHASPLANYLTTQRTSTVPGSLQTSNGLHGGGPLSWELQACQQRLPSWERPSRIQKLRQEEQTAAAAGAMLEDQSGGGRPKSNC